MIYTWYVVNLPWTVGSYQPAGAHKLEQTSPTKRELVLRGWGIIRLRVRVANATFVVKRAVSVATAEVYARAGGGLGWGHDADAGVRDCPWGGGGDGKFRQAMNSPWPQKSVNGPAVLAVVAWLGRTVSRSRSEFCCLSCLSGATVDKCGAGLITE